MRVVKMSQENKWRVRVRNSFFDASPYQSKSLEIIAEDISYDEAQKIKRSLKKKMREDFAQNKFAEIRVEPMMGMPYGAEFWPVFTNKDRIRMELL